MMNRHAMRAGLLTVLLATLGIAPALHAEEGADEVPTKIEGLKLENLLHETLEGVEGTEVIVSLITIPPNSSLPKHWHPGEEFAYILEGSMTLWMEGKEDLVGKAGDVVKIPLKQVHTAITGEEGGKALVFRVHEKGQPERTLVD